MRRSLSFTALVSALAACGGTTPRGPTESSAVAAETTTTAATAPAAPAKTVAEASVLRIMVGGDIIPHRPRLLSPESIGQALAPMQALFATAHAVVANHEAALVDDTERYEPVRAALVATPRWTRELAKSRIAALTLANNHACDAGLGGLERTIGVVEDLGLVGIGADASDAFRPRVLAARAGRRVCAIAWTSKVNAESSKCASSSKLAVAPYGAEGEALIEQAVKAARAASCDAVIAIGHSGDEYAQQTEAAREQARIAAAAGADVVVLHHPHVPSGIEVVTTDDGRRVPLFLSLGNLVSNQGESWHPGMAAASIDRVRVSTNAWTRLGLVADLTFTWESGASSRAGAASLAWGYHLVWTDNERERDHGRKPERIATRPLVRDSDQPIIAVLARDRKGPSRLFESPCWLAVGPGCK